MGKGTALSVKELGHKDPLICSNDFGWREIKGISRNKIKRVKG